MLIYGAQSRGAYAEATVVAGDKFVVGARELAGGRGDVTAVGGTHALMGGAGATCVVGIKGSSGGLGVEIGTV